MQSEPGRVQVTFHIAARDTKFQAFNILHNIKSNGWFRYLTIRLLLVPTLVTILRKVPKSMLNLNLQ